MTLSVHRHEDGTIDISYTEGGVSFSGYDLHGSLVDDQAWAEPAPTIPAAPAMAAAPASEPAVSPTPASPPASTEASVSAYQCPACGRFYTDGPGSCAIEHPATETVQVTVPASTAAANPGPVADAQPEVETMPAQPGAGVEATPAPPAAGPEWPDGSAGSS